MYMSLQWMMGKKSKDFVGILKATEEKNPKSDPLFKSADHNLY